MLIILREDYKGLGKAGEIVKVKDGYAKNFLLPRSFAYPATDAFMNMYKEQTKSKTLKLKKIKNDAERVKASIDGKSLTFQMKAGEDDKLFGSVTAQNIADKLKEVTGEEIDRKKLLINDAIKTLGEHKVAYKLHSDVDITITVNVEKEVEAE